MKFKVGDKIRGTSDNHIVLDARMKLAEVIELFKINDSKNGMVIKIIKHTDKTKIGLKYWVYNVDMGFEIAEEHQMNKLEELEMKLKELSEEIEQLKAEKENGQYKPKYGERYCYINDRGGILTSVWYGDIADTSRYELGNVFKTQEEAEFCVEQLKVEAELRQFARPFKIGGKNYTLGYRRLYDKIEITFSEAIQCGILYFHSKEIVQKAIDTIGEDRIKKYYFGVKN